MKRLNTQTRGIEDWRIRLANPTRQWVRERSAFEAAVCWELAQRLPAGLPENISNVLIEAKYLEPVLLIGAAEHKVVLDGSGGDSQCDFWALLQTSNGQVSLSVEAKADEKFGTGHQSLQKWLKAGTSKNSPANRLARWEHLKRVLPEVPGQNYHTVAYQILHRCAAAIIEAKRFKLTHAVFIVQAFGAPDSSYEEFKKFCEAIGVASEKHQLHTTDARGIQLGVAWIDFPFATNAELLLLNPPTRRRRPRA